MTGIAKKPVTGTETTSFKEASDIHVWKFTCHGPRRRTQYAGVSTDKCIVRVKFLLSACRPVSAAVSYHSLTLESRHRDAHLNPLTGTPSVCA